MRANVEMVLLGDEMVVGWSSESSDAAFKDIRPGMGFRHYEDAMASSSWEDGTSAYTQTRFDNGIAACPADFEANSLFAHDIGMDLLPGAIDFKKGCYIGQEVVSRMQHRGTARKRVMIVSAETPLGAPTEIEAEEKKKLATCLTLRAKPVWPSCASTKQSMGPHFCIRARRSNLRRQTGQATI